jgi:predicted S18 family serine protease
LVVVIITETRSPALIDTVSMESWQVVTVTVDPPAIAVTVQVKLVGAEFTHTVAVTGNGGAAG